MLNCPLISVITPMDVPLIAMVAPIKIPSEPYTVPVTSPLLITAFVDATLFFGISAALSETTLTTSIFKRAKPSLMLSLFKLIKSPPERKLSKTKLLVFAFVVLEIT